MRVQVSLILALLVCAVTVHVADAVCPEATCSGHGTCFDPYCDCDAGWGGNDCGSPILGYAPGVYTGEVVDDEWSYFQINMSLHNYLDNPADVTYTLTSPDCTSGSDWATYMQYTCGGGTGSCINRFPPDSIYSSDTFAPFSRSALWTTTYSSCGCPGGDGSIAETVWNFAFRNNAGHNCTYNFVLNITNDACNYHGVYSPADDACVSCDAGWGGEFCEHPVRTVSAGTQNYNFVGGSVEEAEILQLDVTSGQRLTVDRVGTCSTSYLDIYVSAACVTPPDANCFPFTGNYVSGGSVTSSGEFSVNPWHDWGSSVYGWEQWNECPCADGLAAGFTWYVLVYYDGPTPCTEDVTLTVTDACGAGYADLSLDSDMEPPCVCPSSLFSVEDCGADGETDCCSETISAMTITPKTKTLDIDLADTDDSAPIVLSYDTDLPYGKGEKAAKISQMVFQVTLPSDNECSMRFVAGADCGDCGGVPIPVTYQTAPSNYHVVAASSSTIDLSVYPYNFNYTEAGCGCDADATDVDWYSNFYSTYTSGCETTVSMKKKWWCLNDCDAHSDDDNMKHLKGECVGYFECDCDKGAFGPDCSLDSNWWILAEDDGDSTSLFGGPEEDDGTVAAKGLASSTVEVFNRVPQVLYSYPGTVVNPAIYLSPSNSELYWNTTVTKTSTLLAVDEFTLYVIGTYSPVDGGVFTKKPAKVDIDWGYYKDSDNVDILTVSIDEKKVAKNADFVEKVTCKDSETGTTTSDVESKDCVIEFTLSKPVDEHSMLYLTSVIAGGFKMSSFSGAQNNSNTEYFELSVNGRISDPTGTFLDVVILLIFISLVGGCYAFVKFRPEQAAKLLEQAKARFGQGDGDDEEVVDEKPKSSSEEEEEEGKTSIKEKVMNKAQEQVEDAAAEKGESYVPGDDEEEEGGEEGGEATLAPCPEPQALGIIFLVALLRTAAAIVKSFINLSMIHQSFALYYKIPRLYQLAIDYPGLKLGLSLSGIFDFFTFGVAEATSWNCGGVLLILSPLFVIAGVSVLIAILAKDILLFFAISIEKYKGRYAFFQTRGGEVAWTGVKSFLVAFLFYITQIVVIVVTSLIVSVGGINRTCSGIDFFLASFARIFSIIIVVIAAIVCFFIFAGKPSRDFPKNWGLYAGVLYVLHAFFRVIAVTFGFWLSDTAIAHDVVGRAIKFDDDDEDDENQHEAVVEIMGKSRGMIWLVLPTCLVLSKVSETVNAPPIAVFPSSALELSTPYWKRLYYFVSQNFTLLMVIITALAPSIGMIIVMIISHATLLIGDVLFDTILAPLVQSWALAEKASRAAAAASGSAATDAKNAI